MNPTAARHSLAGARILLLAVLTGGLAPIGALRDAKSFSTRPQGLPPLVATAGAQDATPQPRDCVVEYAGCYRTTDFDPGTIRVFVRNPGPEPVAFEKVVMDGLRVPVWGIDLSTAHVGPDGVIQPSAQETLEKVIPKFSRGRLVWAKVSSPAIAPGAVEEISAKLVYALPRPWKVEIGLANQESKTALVRPVPGGVTITAITFSPELDKLFVYFESRTEDPQKVTGICIDAGSPAAATWISSSVIEKGQKELAVVDLKAPLEAGSPVTVAIRGAERCIGMARLRAFAGFPIGIEGGTGVEELGMDPGRYDQSPPYLAAQDPRSAAAGMPPVATAHGNHIFSCAVHEYGYDWERSARETLRRYDLCRLFDPQHLTYAHLCRIRPETGYAIFSELSDVIRFNPDITTALSIGTKGEEPEATVERITRYAYRSGRPHPIHCVLDMTAMGSKNKQADENEFLRRNYTAIAGGVKGIFYRLAAPQGLADGGLTGAVKRTDEDVKAVRSELSIADPVDWAATDGGSRVSAYALLAGDREVLVFLVGHAAGAAPQTGRKAAGSAPSTNSSGQPGKVQVTLKVPSWLSVKSVQEIAVGKRQALRYAVTQPRDGIATQKAADFRADGAETTFSAAIPENAALFTVQVCRTEK